MAYEFSKKARWGLIVGGIVAAILSITAAAAHAPTYVILFLGCAAGITGALGLKGRTGK
jgi:hypothetical protein